VGELGYRPAGDTWRTAMEVDSKEAGITPQQLRQTREALGKVFQAQLDAAGKRKRPAPTEP
jgi:hypothetical protein